MHVKCSYIINNCKGLSVSNHGYGFLFNGKESDNEVSGSGNEYDYGFRIYNSRLGRFLSLDPLEQKFPWWSPYHFAGNTPIQAIDIDGLETALERDFDRKHATVEGSQQAIKQAKEAAPFMAFAAALGVTAIFAPELLPVIGNAISKYPPAKLHLVS